MLVIVDDLVGRPLIENGQMCGSLIVLETGSLDAAQDWAKGDPYAKAGLFDSVSGRRQGKTRRNK